MSFAREDSLLFTSKISFSLCSPANVPGAITVSDVPDSWRRDKKVKLAKSVCLMCRKSLSSKLRNVVLLEMPRGTSVRCLNRQSTNVAKQEHLSGHEEVDTTIKEVATSKRFRTIPLDFIAKQYTRNYCTFQIASVWCYACGMC